MKRFLLPASALVLVVTACGAGARPAPRVTQVAARLAPTVHELAVRREQAAARDARRLLREFRPPPGARRIRRLPNYSGVMRRSGPGPLGEAVEVHRFWSARMPLKEVLAFLRAHRLRGFERSSATWGSRKPHYLVMSSERPPAGGRSPTRFLTITSVGLPHHTLIRVGVQATWIYPRSPREKVPAATREIVVHTPKISRTVRSPAKVARIIRWFDALPVSPPGIAVACPLMLASQFRLSFRSVAGGRLARALVPATSAGLCDPIGFQIGGKAKRPLIDRDVGPSFVQRLQRLLGVQLVRTVR